MYNIGHRLQKELKKGGWKENHDCSPEAMAFSRVIGDLFHPEAERFVRAFGNLQIYGKLWVTPDQAIICLKEHQPIAKRLGVACCPLGSTSLLSNDSSVWIDESGRFFAVDSEGIVFIASRAEGFLEVMFSLRRCETPPEDLKGLVDNAGFNSL